LCNWDYSQLKGNVFGHSSEQSTPYQGTFDWLLADCDNLNGENVVLPAETEKIEYERCKRTEKITSTDALKFQNTTVV
jgi:hypothetical protein